MRETRARVEPRLEALLRDGPPTLVEAMRWAVLGGGKRLRPILCQWTHDMLEGRQPEAALDLACALELVHAYSLVHDDLPCMDDDDLRRGRPTTHRAFDVATATVAGYQMVALAARDRKSTRLNSSHLVISYAVFCLKKKKKNKHIT